MSIIQWISLTLFAQYFIQHIIFSNSAKAAEKELIEEMFDLFGRPSEKFVKVEKSSNNDSKFPQHLLDLIMRTPHIHSGNKPSFWSHQLLGAAHGIYEGDIKIGGDNYKLWYHMKNDGKSSTIVLALESITERNIRFKGFFIINDKDTLLSEEEIRDRMQTEMLKLHNAVEQNGNVHIAQSHIFKITLHWVKVANDGKSPATERKEPLKYLTMKERNDFSAKSRQDAGTDTNHDFKTIDKDAKGDWNTIHEMSFPLSEKKKFMDSDSRKAKEVQVDIADANDKQHADIFKIMEEYKSNTPKETAAANYKIFQIISNIFLSIKNNEKFLENEMHGFISGFLEFNFARRFQIKVYNELRAGRGYIDLLFTVENKIVNIAEFKLDTATGSEALSQIIETGYVYLKPNIRAETNEALLIGVAFNVDSKKRVSQTVAQFDEVPERNFIHSLLHEVKKKTKPNKDDLVKGQEKTLNKVIDEGALRPEIIKALYYVYYGSYRGSDIGYFARNILGEILATSTYEDNNLNGRKWLLRYPGLDYVYAFLLQSSRLDYAIKIIIKPKGVRAAANQKRESYVTGLPKRLENTIKRKMMCVTIEVDHNNAVFENFLDVKFELLAKTAIQYDQTSSAVDLRSIDSESLIKEILKNAPGRRMNFDSAGKVKNYLKSAFKNLELLVKKEDDFHGILEGIFRGQYDYQVFCEATAGSGRIDIFLKHKSDSTVPPMFLELKLTKLRDDKKIDIVLDDALKQADGYIVHLATEFDCENVVIVAAAYVNAGGEADIQIKASGRSISSAKCSGITRIKRSLLCWDNIDMNEENKDVEDEVEYRLKNGYEVDGDSLAKYLKYKDPIFQSEMIEFYKKLKYHDISDSVLSESPCAKELPSICADKFNSDLIDKDESYEIINRLNGVHENLIISNSLHLEKFGHAIDKLMTVDILNKVLVAILEEDYKSIGNIVGLTVYSHVIAPRMGNILENAFRQHVSFGMIDAVLPKEMPMVLKFQIMRIIFLDHPKLILRAIKTAPFLILNAAFAIQSGVKLIDSINKFLESEGYDKTDAAFGIVENSCDILAYMADSILMIYGKSQYQAVVMFLQFTCDEFAESGRLFVQLSRFSDDIVITPRDIFWTIAELNPIIAYFGPDVTEELVQNIRMKKIYESLYFNSPSFHAYDFVITSLVDVKYEKDDERISDEEIINSNFLQNRRYNMSDDLNFFLKYPANPVVKIATTLRNETEFTENLSRTLKKLTTVNGTDYKIACGPTGSNAILNSEGLYSISEIEKVREFENFCAFSIAVGILRNESNEINVPKVLFDLPSTNKSLVQGGNDTNYFMFYYNSDLILGPMKNILDLTAEFNPRLINSTLASKIAIILNNYSFTEVDALSDAGKKADVLLGTEGVRQDIYAAERTSHIKCGSKNYVNGKHSESPYIQIDISGECRMDLREYKGDHVGLTIFDSKIFNEGDFAQLFLPPFFDVERGFLITMLHEHMTLDAALLTLYDFEFDSARNVLAILKSYGDGKRALMCKIYTTEMIRKLHVYINANIRINLLFNEKNRKPELIDIYHNDPLPHGLEKAGEHLLEYLEEGTSNNGRYYNENPSLSVTFHNKLVPTDFVLIRNKGIINQTTIFLVYPRGAQENVFFVETRNTVGIVIRNKYPFYVSDLPYFVYINASITSTKIRKEDDNLIFSYTGSDERTSVIMFINFLRLMPQNHEIIIHANNAFLGKIVKSGGANYEVMPYVRATIHKIVHLPHFFTVLSVKDLTNVSSLFFPGIYDVSDLLVLSHNHSLIVSNEKKHKSLFIENYSKFLNISLVFVNKVTSLAKIVRNSKFFVEHIKEQDRTLLHNMIENNDIKVVKIEHSFSLHLDQSLKLFVLISYDAITEVSISVLGENYNILSVNSTTCNIQIYNWDENTNIQPLFIFDSSILDIRLIPINETNVMRQVLETKQRQYRITHSID